MRINEWNKNAAEGKGANGSAGKINTKKLYDISINSCKAKPDEDSFRNSLQKIMIQEEAMKEYRGKPDEAGRGEKKKTARIEHELGQSKAESVNIRVDQNMALKEPKEIPVRKIPYQECDKVEINILEGYVLKAKKEKRQGRGEEGYPVYIEKKNDDGETKAYLFDGMCSRKDSQDEMERMAYAVTH